MNNKGFITLTTEMLIAIVTLLSLVLGSPNISQTQKDEVRKSVVALIQSQSQQTAVTQPQSTPQNSGNAVEETNNQSNQTTTPMAEEKTQPQYVEPTSTFKVNGVEQTSLEVSKGSEITIAWSIQGSEMFNCKLNDELVSQQGSSKKIVEQSENFVLLCRGLATGFKIEKTIQVIVK